MGILFLGSKRKTKPSGEDPRQECALIWNYARKAIVIGLSTSAGIFQAVMPNSQVLWNVTHLKLVK